MTVSLVNNEQDIIKDKPPKLTYGLLQTLLFFIDESSFWTSGFMVLPIKLISGLTEVRVKSILQQPNNFLKKVNNKLKRNLDLTQTYSAFILSEGELDSFFIEKSLSKLGILLDTITNHQFNNVFSLTNGFILEIDECCIKSDLSNTHFRDIFNHLSIFISHNE